jgi:hypothetical protein
MVASVRTPSPYSSDQFLNVASAATGGNTGRLTGFGDIGVLQARLAVDAIGGSLPYLTVAIEETFDPATAASVYWRPVVNFATIGPTLVSPTQLYEEYAAPFADALRVSYTIAGSSVPKYGFRVDIITRASSRS